MVKLGNNVSRTKGTRFQVDNSEWAAQDDKQREHPLNTVWLGVLAATADAASGHGAALAQALYIYHWILVEAHVEVILKGLSEQPDDVLTAWQTATTNWVHPTERDKNLDHVEYLLGCANYPAVELAAALDDEMRRRNKGAAMHGEPRTDVANPSPVGMLPVKVYVTSGSQELVVMVVDAPRPKRRRIVVEFDRCTRPHEVRALARRLDQVADLLADGECVAQTFVNQYGQHHSLVLNGDDLEESPTEVLVAESDMGDDMEDIEDLSVSSNVSGR